MSLKRLIVFDSGFGGLSVVSALRARQIGGRLYYVADHAGFPYGALDDEAVIARVLATIQAAVDDEAGEPEAVIIACSTASTLALPALRARWTFPVIGVVPALKPAARETKSGLVSALVTAGTARRRYLRDLIEEHAGEADVTIAAAPNLAAMAEAFIRGEELSRDALAREIAPAFIERDGARTDMVALGCTHYPLLLEALKAAAPWPVTWIDPAEAIARRVEDVAGALYEAEAADGVLRSTAPPELAPALRARLDALGLQFTPDALPLASGKLSTG